MSDFDALTDEERANIKEIVERAVPEAEAILAELEASGSSAAAFDRLEATLTNLEQAGITREDLLDVEQAMQFRALGRGAREWVRSAICPNPEARKLVEAAVNGGIGSTAGAVAAVFVAGIAAIPIAFGVGIVASVAAVIVYREGIESLCKGIS